MPPSAEADEDAILPSASSHPQTHADSDSDADDGAPSLAFLNSLTSAPSRASFALPKRGLKDFQPNPTDLQASTLTASRDAMHVALCHTRTHAPKNHIVGLYDEESGLTLVRRPRGNLFGGIGRSVGGKDSGVWLEPEEALWALERGSLDILWPAQPLKSLTHVESNDSISEKRHSRLVDDTEDEDDTISLSLQAAYALYLGGPQTRHLTPERYQVYAHLRRSGFNVQRAEGFEGKRIQATVAETATAAAKLESNMTGGLLHWLFSLIGAPRSNDERPFEGSLVRPGLYRSYADIYRQLQIISSKPVRLCEKEAEREHDTPFTTHFNIYKPSPNFRKTAPGPPSFRVCIIDSRLTQLPSLTELSSLIEEQPTMSFRANDASTKGSTGVGGMYKTLKHGGKSVVLAVVDEGVVSYLRFGEADFKGASTFLWEEGGAVVGAKGKRGAGRGGRGGRERGGRG